MLRMQCKKDGDGDDSFGGKRDQRMVHLDFFGLLGGFGLMTALLDSLINSRIFYEISAAGYTYLMASSKTLLRFRCVSAEHSRYFTARISLATCTACS